MKIKSADIRPGDVVKFEFGDYDNWVTVRIDQATITNETGRLRQRLDWHYLSEESLPQSNLTQHTCYGDPSEYIDLIERSNLK